MPPFFIAEKWCKTINTGKKFHFFVLSAVKRGGGEFDISFKMAVNTA